MKVSQTGAPCAVIIFCCSVSALWLIRFQFDNNFDFNDGVLMIAYSSSFKFGNSIYVFCYPTCCLRAMNLLDLSTLILVVTANLSSKSHLLLCDLDLVLMEPE